MKNIITNIEENSKKNDGIDSIISKYIIDNLSDGRILNLNTIAKNCWTSPSTVTRYAKKMGYSGFAELKIYMNDYLKEVKLIKRNSKEKIHNITDINLDFIIDSLTKTKNMLDQDSVSKFYNKINEVRNIYIFAQGGTYIIAYDFYVRLLRLNYNVQAINDPVIQQSLIKNATNDNGLFILISFSGHTNEVVGCSHLLKKRNIDYISFTSNRENEVKNNAWLSFVVPYENSQLRRMLNSSRMYLFFLVDSITTYIAIHLEGMGIGANLK